MNDCPDVSDDVLKLLRLLVYRVWGCTCGRLVRRVFREKILAGGSSDGPAGLVDFTWAIMSPEGLAECWRQKDLYVGVSVDGGEFC